MAKSRITNMGTERRRLLAAWFGIWLDDAMKANFQKSTCFPGWNVEDTRQVLLTLRDLQKDCENRNFEEIIETGGYNDVPYGRKSY